MSIHVTVLNESKRVSKILDYMRYLDDAGSAWVTTGELAALCGVSESSQFRAMLKMLVVFGCIEVDMVPHWERPHISIHMWRILGNGGGSAIFAGDDKKPY